MNRMVLALSIILCMALAPPLTLAQTDASHSISQPPGMDSSVRDAFRGESVEAPYSIDLWVDQTAGPRHPGTKVLIQDFLKQALQSLGSVTLVHGLSGPKPTSMLRMRVWFSQWEKPDAYDCYDTTLSVVVGKTSSDKPSTEVVLDAYALAGVSDRDLSLMCQKIVTRLDVNVLSPLMSLNDLSRSS